MAELLLGGEQTRLRARAWPAAAAEPAAWAVDHLDATPELQHTAGSFAADLFNDQGVGGLSIDDDVITSP